MYFAYIDESGTSDPKDTNNYFYVLIALIMHEKGTLVESILGVIYLELGFTVLLRIVPLMQ